MAGRLLLWLFGVGRKGINSLSCVQFAGHQNGRWKRWFVRGIGEMLRFKTKTRPIQIDMTAFPGKCTVQKIT